MLLILQYLAYGLALGAIYALIAIGYTMVYGVLKFINFAHGEVMMVGSYFCLLLWQLLQQFLPQVNVALLFCLALFVALLLAVILGLSIERLAYRKLRTAPRLAALLSAVGVSIILANGAALLWGTQARSFPTPYENTTVKIFEGLNLPLHDVVIFFVGLFCMACMYVLIRYTTIGKALRATSLDTEMASLLGININRVISFAFALGSMLATIAGVLVAMRSSLDPSIGNYYGLKAFIASVIGGIGSIPGAMLGGLLLGVLESFGTVVAGSYKDTISFVILILLLLIKPEGLLGRKEVDKV